VEQISQEEEMIHLLGSGHFEDPSLDCQAVLETTHVPLMGMYMSVCINESF
jgi:hypothetical protein